MTVPDVARRSLIDAVLSLAENARPAILCKQVRPLYDVRQRNARTSTPRRCGATTAVLLAALTSALVFSDSLHAQSEPRQTQVEAHEWSVWVANPAQTTFNTSRLYGNAMPNIVGTSRPRLDENKVNAFNAAPISVVQMFGEPSEDVDVDLQVKKGSILSHWPPGKARSGRLQWFKSSLSLEVPEGIPLSFLPPGHWFQKLRANDKALYLKHESSVDRFLAYDVQLTLAVPVRIRGGPDEYTLQNLTAHPLKDVAVIAPSEKGFRVGWLDELASGAAPKQEEEKKESTDEEKANELFDDAEKSNAPKVEPLPAEGDANIQAGVDQQLNRPVDVAVEKTPRKQVLDLVANQVRLRYDLDGPTLAAAGVNLDETMDLQANDVAARDVLAQVLADVGLSYRVTEEAKLFITTTARLAEDAEKKGRIVEGPPVKLVMSQPLPADDPSYREFTRDSLARRLADQGLRKEHVELLLTEYSSSFFEPGELIVLVHFNRSAIDEAIVLDVFPPPTKLVRTATLLVHGVDPRLQDRIRELVDQLGSETYKTREAAEERLAQLGPVAVPVLEEALNHADAEIVFRAERLLRSMQREVR